MKNSLDYACLFGGGAIRGAAHVGVLKAFEKISINPTLLCGSSVGSIVAALIAAGYNSEELEQVFLDVNFELFRDISFGFSQKFAISKGEIFLEWFRELIEKKYYGNNYIKGKNNPVKFKDISKNLIIITTDLKTFKCNEFSTFCTPDFEIAMAVRISCCMPGLMRAVNLDDKLLVDGDLMKGRPMWSLSKNIQLCPDRILEIRLEGSFSGSDQNPLEYVNGMYTCMTYSETSFIKNIYSKHDKYDYLVIDTGDTIVVDFNCPEDKRKKLIENGYQQAMDYFSNQLINKKQNLKNIYSNILINLNKVRMFMLTKKYFQAKNTLALLFADLIDISKILNEEIYSEIKILQNLIFENVKVGLLGRSSCKNIPEIIKNLDATINKLSEIIKDFENYNQHINKTCPIIQEVRSRVSL